jgi:hypothetical protein
VSDASAAREPVFYLREGKVARRHTRKDGDSIIRTLVNVNDRPGEHEGESRDAHPRLTLESPKSRDASAKAAR